MALKEKFNKGGFDYQLIKRQSDIAIYSQKMDGYGFEYFEVIKVQTVKTDVETKFMSLKAGTEFYPSSNQWGSDGWTFKTLEQAEAKLNQLINDKITI